MSDNKLPERVLALLAKHGGWQATLDHIASLESRLAALAGAAPVAWDYPICDEPRYPGDPMRAAIYDAEDAARLKAKGYDVRPLFPHAPAKAREDDCAERCKRRHPHTQLTVTRYIAPDSLWFWNVTMPDGHMFDLGKGFDSAEAAMTDAADAGIKALHKAETFARAALATFAEGAE